MNIGRWMEITFMLILAYLILSNYKGFAAAINSIGGAYTSSVRALQGR